MRTRPAFIVDDSAEYRLFLQFFFKRLLPDYPIEFFEGPYPLLGRLSELREGEDLLPGLIMLDLQMSGLDGYQVLQCLKAPGSADNQWWKDLHVIFNSATVDEALIATCLNAGASAFFSKPTSSEELNALRDYLLEHRQIVP